jgi:hypothetical protein
MDNGRNNNTLEKFFDLCRQRNFKKAMVRLLPRQIGDALAELMFGEDLPKLIEQFHKREEAKQNEILKKLEDLMALRTDARKPVIAIGSGYDEIIVESMHEVTLGNKHTIKIQNLIGGSGANFALRLMAAGYASMPILPIGNDKAGKYIREEVVKALTKVKAPEALSAYVKSDSFLNCSIKTPMSIILASRTGRTVFVQKLDGAEHFHTQLESQLDFIDALFDGSPGPIMIGHIQSDSVDGTSTKAIINRYRNRSLIYTVFGNSQIEHGWEFWEEKNT